MQGVTTKSILRLLGVVALVLGLAGPALAQLPPGPPAQVPPWLADVLDRLDDIETKIDNQSTDLRGVTQNWDKKLSGAERFTVLTDFNDKAVRDNETGLVWEQSPDPTPQGSWSAAITHCAQLEVDDRKGWALPMREQLASLVDETGTGVDSNGDPLKLPDGHPFDPAGVQSAGYWSASTVAANPIPAWFVNFFNGFVTFNGKVIDFNLAWCVRGGQVYDGQDVLQAP
jgi:hypothetical protein